MPTESEVDLETSNQHNRLDDHVIRYFVHVKDVLSENSFEDEDNKGLFLRSVFDEVKKDFIRLCKNWKTSRILEDLVHHFNEKDQLKWLCQAACRATPDIISNHFGSHVLQQIFRVLLFPGETFTCTSTSYQDLIHDFTSMIETFVLENIDSIIHDMYASHVLSEMLQVLGGTMIDMKISRSKGSMNYQKRFKLSKPTKSINSEDGNQEGITKINQTAPEFLKCLKTVLKTVLDISNFGELLTNQYSCPVLQTVLLVSKVQLPKICLKICNKILKKGNLVRKETEEFGLNESSPLLLLDAVASHLVEKLMCVMSGEQQEQLYEECLKKNLTMLSLHRTGHFLVKTFFRTCQSSDIAEAALRILCDNINDILLAGHSQVVVQMAFCCLKHRVMQKEFMSLVRDALCQSNEQKEQSVRARNFIVMKNYAKEDKNEQDDKAKHLNPMEVNYHGCCLLKYLLQFDHPKKVATSLVKMDPSDIVTLCRHSHGSMIMEALLQSESVQHKKKLSLVPFFSDNLKVIICDKFGSFVFDKFWAILDLPQKESVCEKLKKIENVVQRSFHGKLVLKNCGLQQYSHDILAWRKSQSCEKSKLGETIQPLAEETLKNTTEKDAIKRSAKETDASPSSRKKKKKKRKTSE